MLVTHIMGRIITFSAFSGLRSNFHVKTGCNDGLVRRADSNGEIRGLVGLSWDILGYSRYLLKHINGSCYIL